MVKILIIGVGNILLKDDGIGVHVIQHLEKINLPQHVQIIDCGTGLINLISYLDGIEKLIFIDAIKTGSEPGTIYKLTDKDICESPKQKISLHQFGVIDVLELMEKTGKKPSITIIGIEPKEIDIGMELSSEIETKIPKIISIVLEEICCGEKTNIQYSKFNIQKF